MPQPFNAASQKVLRTAQHFAEHADGVVTPNHLLTALLVAAPQVWQELPHIDRQKIMGALPPFNAPEMTSEEKSNTVLANSVKRVLAYSMEEWFRAHGAELSPGSPANHLLHGSEYITPEFILLGLLREVDSDAAQLLASYGLTSEEARSRLGKTRKPDQ